MQCYKSTVNKCFDSGVFQNRVSLFFTFYLATVANGGTLSVIRLLFRLRNCIFSLVPQTGSSIRRFILVTGTIGCITAE